MKIEDFYIFVSVNNSLEKCEEIKKENPREKKKTI